MLKSDGDQLLDFLIFGTLPGSVSGLVRQVASPPS